MLFCLVYLLSQNLGFFTIWFTGLANVNTGVVTILWSTHPLFMAIADHFIYGQAIGYYHFIGMALILSSVLILSLKMFLYPIEELFDINIDTWEAIPPFVPVVFAIVTPIVFTMNGILVRKLTSPDSGINFNGKNLSFASQLLVNTFILIVAISYWQSHHYSGELFLFGTLGSIINTLGLYLSNLAYTNGPLGPVSSITCSSNILLIIVEALIYKKVPTWVEILGFLLGFAGTLEIVFPKLFEMIFKCKRFSDGSTSRSK